MVSLMGKPLGMKRGRFGEMELDIFVRENFVFIVAISIAFVFLPVHIQLNY